MLVIISSGFFLERRGVEEKGERDKSSVSRLELEWREKKGVEKR